MKRALRLEGIPIRETSQRLELPNAEVSRVVLRRERGSNALSTHMTYAVSIARSVYTEEVKFVSSG